MYKCLLSWEEKNNHSVSIRNSNGYTFSLLLFPISSLLTLKKYTITYCNINYENGTFTNLSINPPFPVPFFIQIVDVFVGVKLNHKKQFNFN